MLRIVVPETELWDEKNEVFVYVKEHKLQLEHSLVSVQKWEQKWCKSYFSRKEKTREEILDYIRCMTITQNVDPYVYYCLTRENEEQIKNYIDAPMTAVTFPNEKKGGRGREVITAEIIYHWMISLQIPFECRKWHLNSLIALIKVCNIKNQPPKKMGSRELASHHRAINAARRKGRRK